MNQKRRADDHMTAREVLNNVVLGFSIVFCIAFAVGMKMFSRDSTVVDIIAGVFMLIAIGLALPMRFKGFLQTVGPYIPIIGRGPAERAVAATEKAVEASQKAAVAVKEAVADVEAKQGD